MNIKQDEAEHYSTILFLNIVKYLRDYRLKNSNKKVSVPFPDFFLFINFSFSLSTL